MANMKLVFMLFIFIISACGMEEVPALRGTEWEPIEFRDNRPIIAKLEPTSEETSARDQELEELMQREEFQNGFYGPEPRAKELAQHLLIQHVESEAVQSVFDEVYGGREEFAKEGIIFIGSE